MIVAASVGGYHQLLSFCSIAQRAAARANSSKNNNNDRFRRRLEEDSLCY